MRLRDLWADEPTLLTHRELINLIKHLPRESATAGVLLGPAADWSQDTHLLADVVDGIGQGIWQRGGGRGKKPKAMKRPEPKRGG